VLRVVILHVEGDDELWLLHGEEGGVVPTAHGRAHRPGEPCAKQSTVFCSVPDTDPPDPHVYGPPGSGSISQRYGSGSFYHQARIARKSLIPTDL
jgi:hypothetical protein